VKILSPRHPEKIAKTAFDFWVWQPDLVLSTASKLKAIGIDPAIMLDTSGEERMRITADGTFTVSFAQEIQELAEDYAKYFPEDTE
jgi:hypothetical protein